MILLDTNAVLWSLVGHRRARALHASPWRLYISPVTLLEIQFLIEVGRISAADADALAIIETDPRWQLDSPSTDALFKAAIGLGWTRDPFDRLIAAHALLRGWRLATGDRRILDRLPPAATLAL